MTDVKKIDSSSVGLYIAEEQSIRVLPTVPVWQELEPSEVGDIGGETTQVARNIINPSRQNLRGAITDLSASANFNQEISQNNTIGLLQGFVFADARETWKTQPLNKTGTTVSADTDKYVLTNTAFDVTNLAENSLIKASGFTNVSNNGLKQVTAIASGEISVTGVVTESVGSGKLEVVGYKASNVTIGITGSVTVGFANADGLGLTLGQWIFVGGDTDKPTDNGCFFGRISAIDTDLLTIDMTSIELVAETIATCDIFFGTVLHNEEDIDLIKRRTYTIEERLGFADEERTIPQASYVSGCVPNEVKFNLETASLATAEYSFMGCKFYTRKGSLLSGDRKPMWGEKGYNNSNEVYMSVLSVVPNDSEVTKAQPLFTYMENASITINNNGSENKAVGVLGNFDISAGKFDVTGECSCYFTNVDTIKALQENVDAGLQVILSRNNEGMIFDIPCMGVGSSIPSVADGEPVKMSLTANGAKSKFGYTFTYNNFAYLPQVAMASEFNAD